MRKAVLILVAVGLVWAGKVGVKSEALRIQKPTLQSEVFAIKNNALINGKDVVYIEDFEDCVMPADWTVIDANGDGVTWTVGTTDDLGSYIPPNYGTCYAYYSDDDAGYGGGPSNPEGLVSPVIDISGYTNLYLVFSLGFQSYEYDDTLFVYGTFDGTYTYLLGTYVPDVSDIMWVNLSPYLPADNIQISFNYVDHGGWNWAVGVDNVTLTTTPPEIHDVGINIIYFMTLPFTVNGAEEIIYNVKNFGTFDETNIPFYAYVNGIELYDTIPFLAVGDSVNIVFDFTPTTEEILDIHGETQLADDNPTNDAFDFTEYAYPTGTIWAEGFEYLSSFPPPGWVVINNDGGYYTWNWYTGYPHTGYNMTAVHWEYPNNDDWLITDAITPQAGYADSIGFFHAAYSSTWSEYLQVWAMSGQTVADTLALLWEDDNIVNTDYERVTVSLDAFDGQTIYIAFRSLSPNAYYNLVDDIFYMSVLSTGVEEGSVVLNPTLRLLNNPVKSDGAILFSIPNSMNISLKLYDATGRLVKTLAHGPFSAGSHTITFSTRNLSSGVYFAKLEAGASSLTTRIVVVK